MGKGGKDDKKTSKPSGSPKKPAADGPRRQVAALPWRRVEGSLEVCLVTTRETKRWTLPKGWPMKNRTDRAAARLEAEQEAGLYGKISGDPIGDFTYFKRLTDRFELVRVDVWPLAVEKQRTVFKEMGEREVRWMSAGDAALLVEEPELATLLEGFAPKG